MKQQRAFAIGSFHFGYRPKVPFEYKTTEYIEALGAALRSLPSINKLSIDYDDYFNESYAVKSDPSSLNLGEDHFPNVAFLRIRFSIYIPFRVQDEVVEPLGVWTGTENFSVFLKNSFHGPVAYIECLNAEAECKPTQAVRLLREYLKREFKKMGGPITFEFLGPAPFHADFFLRNKEGVDGEFAVQILPKRGYGSIVFECEGNPETLPSAEDLSSLFEKLENELGIFYSIQKSKVKFMRWWDRLIADWEKLRALVGAEVNLLNVPQRMRIHKASKQLISEAYLFGVELDIALSDTQQYLGVYGKDRRTYLERFVRGKADSLPKYPVESVLGWARHVNEASFKQAEIVAVIFAGLIGGIVGSLITALLTNS